jgi:CRISPR/Cas system-associated exonuclease Cas4 (RecB family)
MNLRNNFNIQYKNINHEHLYDIVDKNNKIIASNLPSVTKILGIVGGKKAELLKNWAIKQAIEYFRTEAIKIIAKNNGYISNKEIEEISKNAYTMPFAITRQAADIGSRLHAEIDTYIINNIEGKPYTPVLTPDIEIGYQNFLRMLVRYNIKFVLSDTAVASAKLKYGGRLDSLAMINGELALCDWKTSSNIYLSHQLQLTAYLIAVEETFSILPTKGYIFRFDKMKKEFEMQEVNFEELLELWINITKLFHLMKQIDAA